MARWTKSDITLVATDGSAAFTATLSGVGDFSVDGIAGDNREAVAVYERDAYVGAVPGQTKAQSWSCTVNLENNSLTHASAERILDFVRNANSYAAATTTDPGGREWLFKLTATLNDGVTSTTLVLPNNRVEASMDESGEVVSVSLSGTNYVLPVYA